MPFLRCGAIVAIFIVTTEDTGITAVSVIDFFSSLDKTLKKKSSFFSSKINYFACFEKKKKKIVYVYVMFTLAFTLCLPYL